MASLAVVLNGDKNFIQGASLILGGVAPKPWRAESAELSLMGSAISESVAEQAGIAATDGAKPLRHNRYKVTLVRNIVRDSLLQLAQESGPVTA